MNLRVTAADDLVKIHNDADGFRWAITVTDPSAFSESLYGLSTDIGQSIDPDTGLIVSGRSASVSLCISDLIDAGFTSLPEGIPDETQRPWVIEFDDINGNAFKFKVQKTMPDRGFGSVVCLLENYK